MKVEGARRLKPGDLVWWRHKGLHEGVVLALHHRDGLLLRVHIEARRGSPGRAKRYLSFRRLYYREPEVTQLAIPGIGAAAGRGRANLLPERPAPVTATQLPLTP